MRPKGLGTNCVVVAEDYMSRRNKVVVEGISPENPLRVLYIAGYGRSGSTILDTILGCHSQIESVGEACHIVRNAWLADDAYCACGQKGHECDFWQRVRERWLARVGSVDMESYVNAARQIESRVRISATRRGLVASDPIHLEYVRRTASLLAAIRDASGTQVVVDSSKTSSRALALSMVDGLDLRLVHLVRDCRGVLWSTKKRFRKDNRAGISKDDRGGSLTRTMKAWAVSNLLAGQVRRTLPPQASLRIRYEDFVIEPHRELRRIGDLLEMDMTPLVDAVCSGEAMDIGHTIAGNRMRMAGTIRLSADVEWIDRLTWREQAACWSLVGWLMKAYGYRWNAVSASKPIVPRAA